jgi:hypothetical protein
MAESLNMSGVEKFVQGVERRKKKKNRRNEINERYEGKLSDITTKFGDYPENAR